MSLFNLPGLALGASLLVGAGLLLADEASVSGSATYRERIAMPPGAVFEVVLEDVSLADAPAVTLGRVVREEAGQPPYDFEIAYDPDEIGAERRYAVRAQLSFEGALIFATDTVHPVLTGGAPDRVEMVMVRVPDDTPDDNAIRPRHRGGRIAMGQPDATGDADPGGANPGEAEPAETQVMVPETAGAEQAVAESATEEAAPGVPALKGPVTYRGEEARFIDCRSGREYPIADDGDIEALVHAYLAAGMEPGAPIMVSFEGGIEPRAGDGGAEDVETVVVERFVGVWPDQTCEQALGNATLKNTEWRIGRLGGTEIPAEDPEDSADPRAPILLLDASEGRFSATAGCNRLVGGFEQDEAQLSFGPVAATMMACPPPLDLWERQLAEVLAETAEWRIEGDMLELLDAAGAPLAAFTARYRY